MIDSSLVFRASALERAGRYNEDPQYWVSEDYEFMSRLAFHCRGRVLPEPLIEYRLHPSSVCALNREDQLVQCDVIARGNVQRATGLKVDDVSWAAWHRFFHSLPGARVSFSSDEVTALNRMIPALLRGVKHDPDDRCVLPWVWTRHALALALLRRGSLSHAVRAHFLFLALNIAVHKLIWH